MSGWQVEGGVAGTHCTQPKAWRNEIPRAKIHYTHAPFLPRVRTLLYPPLTSSDHNSAYRLQIVQSHSPISATQLGDVGRRNEGSHPPGRLLELAEMLGILFYYIWSPPTLIPSPFGGDDEQTEEHSVAPAFEPKYAGIAKLRGFRMQRTLRACHEKK
ncbi:hypothetical protein E4U14_008197 [Claviceps sp. LM454 group G7]|nr:hypothetical protein E4U14_008197 [Claviceps sp. LM454 group G7]